MAAQVARVQAAADDFFKEYDADIDQEVTAAMFRMIHDDVARDPQPSVMDDIEKKYKSNFDAWAEKVFCHEHPDRQRARLEAFLAKPKLKTMEGPGRAGHGELPDALRAVLGPP